MTARGRYCLRSSGSPTAQFVPADGCDNWGAEDDGGRGRIQRDERHCLYVAGSRREHGSVNNQSLFPHPSPPQSWAPVEKKYPGRQPKP